MLVRYKYRLNRREARMIKSFLVSGLPIENICNLYDIPKKCVELVKKGKLFKDVEPCTDYNFIPGQTCILCKGGLIWVSDETILDPTVLDLLTPSFASNSHAAKKKSS